MKIGKITFCLTALAFIATLIFTNCKKKKTEDPPVVTQPATQDPPDSESASSADYCYAETVSTDIQCIGAQGSENSSLTTYKNPNGYFTGGIMVTACATIIPNGSLKTFTVDFGTGCLGTDARLRSGMLIYNYSASTNTAIAFRHPGFVCSVTAVNYVVDGYSITINNKTISNTTPAGFDPTVTPETWNINSDINIAKPSNGGTVTYVCSRTLKLLNTSDPFVYKGVALPIDWTKAKIQIDGTANGTNAGGESYTATTAALVRDFTCTPNIMQPHRHPFISGTIAYKPGSRAQRTIDFGTGTCDTAYTITINGTTYGPFGQ